MLFIVVLTGLNVVGVRPTGRAAVVLSVFALLPIALVVVFGLAAATQVPWRPFAAEGRTVGASLRARPGGGHVELLRLGHAFDLSGRGQGARSTHSGARSSWRYR